MKPYVPYSEEIAAEICLVVSTHPRGLPTLCKENSHWPHPSNIYRWMHDHAGFRDNYAKAKARQVECLVDEALISACDGSYDRYVDEDGNERVDYECVQRARLKVDTIKWFASKLAPKLYGDKAGQDETEKKLDVLQEEMRSLKDIASKCLQSI